MKRFYVRDKDSANACHYSRDHNFPVAVSGLDAADGKVKIYRGVVQSVEDYGPSARAWRWRVTILDSKVTIIRSFSFN
jgi:hypothetical protein